MKIFFVVPFMVSVLACQALHLPGNSFPAMSGENCIAQLKALSRSEREDSLYSFVVHGRIPNFLRTLVPIKTSATINGKDYTLEYYAASDYISIGNDSDYFLCPMTPLLAQRIVDTLMCILPTKKMVDQIYAAATVKLRPQPIPPDTDMTKIPRFVQHNDSVQLLRNPLLGQFPLGSLVGGTKKDIIIHQKIYSELKPNRPKPVVIYGWHQLNGEPIQPPNNWHQETYVDYSHGVRLVQKMAKINGADISLVDILQDEVYHSLVADTVLTKPYYEIPHH